MTTVATALDKIGVHKPTWKTIVVRAEQEVNVPQALLWEAWSKLEDWPVWSKPLHIAAHWVGEPGWQVGAKFEQELNLGFPVGKTKSAETVGIVIAGRSARWWKEENGIKSCHIWDFERLNAHRTRILNIEVFHGTSMGLIRAFVIRNWQRMFDQAVHGLVEYAQKP